MYKIQFDKNGFTVITNSKLKMVLTNITVWLMVAMVGIGGAALLVYGLHTAATKNLRN